MKAAGERCGQGFKLSEPKPLVVNQQCLVYQFKCELYDTGNVGSHAGSYINPVRNTEFIFSHWQTFHALPGEAFLRGSWQEFYNFEEVQKQV